MMSMDAAYAYECGPDETKPLETLSTIADEAERTATLISAFITRFRHGHISGNVGGEKATLAPVPSGHAGQLNRLRDAVSQLDMLARDLNTLG
jgi:hypothetical protein